MKFEKALEGMKAGKKATFARCTGCFLLILFLVKNIINTITGFIIKLIKEW